MMLVVLPTPPLVLAQAMTFAIIAPSESFGQHACLRLACLLCNIYIKPFHISYAARMFTLPKGSVFCSFAGPKSLR